LSPIGKGGILCPRCRKFISADEPTCPYCGLIRPGAQKILRNKLAFLFSADPIKVIISVNAVLFVLSLLINPTSQGLALNPLTILSPSDRSLLVMGATGTMPIDAYGSWWTLVSASYLHGGILHIFFNMMALMQLGPFVLSAYGLSRFFLLYVLTGIAGFFVSYLAGIPLTIGASASICGLIGAILYYGKSRGGYFGDVIYRQAMGWTIGLILFGLMIPGINNWAHGGGLLSGLLVGYLAGYEERRRENSVHRYLGFFSLAVTALILAWVLVRAFYVLLLG
jgi:rhomboid protease GluP